MKRICSVFSNWPTSWGVEQRALHRQGIAGIGPEIAVALVVRGHERRAAREIDHDVAFGPCPVLERGEDARAPPGRGQLREAIDAQGEAPERAGERRDAPGHDVDVGGGRDHLRVGQHP